MILIKRIVDNEIMNDRQSASWQGASKLAAMQRGLAELPLNTDPQVIERVTQAIDSLQAQKATWEGRRIQAVINQYGGVPSDYAIIDVPTGEEWQALSARYITIDADGVLNYEIGPIYTHTTNTITVNPGWVVGNYRLKTADVTDVSGLSLSEPLYFELVFAQNDATKLISVQILVRHEDEEFDTLPAGLTLLYAICHGRIGIYNTLTMGVV